MERYLSNLQSHLLLLGVHILFFWILVLQLLLLIVLIKTFESLLSFHYLLHSSLRIGRVKLGWCSSSSWFLEYPIPCSCFSLQLDESRSSIPWLVVKSAEFRRVVIKCTGNVILGWSRPYLVPNFPSPRFSKSNPKFESCLTIAESVYPVFLRWRC